MYSGALPCDRFHVHIRQPGLNVVLEEVNKDVSQPELLFAAGTIVVQKESGKVPAIVELNRADDHSWVL